MEIYYKRKLEGEIIGLLIDGVTHPNYLKMEITDNLPKETIELIKIVKEKEKAGLIKDDPTLLERLRNIKLKEIEENYKKVISQPYAYNKNVFETDEKSLDTLNKVLVALPDNGSITWRTADNKMVTLTKQDLLTIAQELLQRNQGYFLKRCELKDKLKSLDNLEDIKNFNTSII